MSSYRRHGISRGSRLRCDACGRALASQDFGSQGKVGAHQVCLACKAAGRVAHDPRPSNVLEGWEIDRIVLWCLDHQQPASYESIQATLKDVMWARLAERATAEEREERAA